ncbi:helix-turn-helix domain-containing protein [Nocardia sp. alder85J]|uniref:helix-turn-helix domain-containing protein n=1 Tax=Nocardia sp. alder85J TaxID=2862949 RepID=UPI001CD44403|nr:helix-turn-helix transcriptional regulator [Nocardia sp. alder85J]MCX4099138.1 helix-turn-helix transcriptional regulator [Nocardia sp. alder85J]
MTGPAVPQSLGGTLRLLRKAQNLTQDFVARRCDVDRSYVAHAEAGRQSPPRKFWAAADDAVGAGGALLAAYDAGVDQRGNTSGLGLVRIGHTVPMIDLASLLDPDLERWMHVNRRELIRVLGLAGTLPATALLAGLEQQRRLVTGRAVDAAAIDHIESVLNAVAEQYEAFGPRAVLEVRQSQATLVDALLPDCPAHLLPRLLTVRASLARVLGWMAYDAGDLAVAGHHYELARRAADEADNPSMTALVLCNMSIAATRGGHPGIGVDHAMAARYWAVRAADQHLSAYAHDMAAEAHAELGQARECRSALEQAREIISTAADSTLPGYVYDAALSAGFAAECLTKLGDPAPAVDAAHRCVTMINPAYALSRGFADVGLGTALCLAGEADEAAAVVARAATTAVGYGSARLAGEVATARDSIAAHAPGSAALRELDTILTSHNLG